MWRESSCPPSLQGFWKSGHQLRPTRPSQTLLQSTSRSTLPPPPTPSPMPATATSQHPSFSLPGSDAFPSVIAVRRPAMCYKWDKLQRLGDVSCGWMWVGSHSSQQPGHKRDGWKVVRFHVCVRRSGCICLHMCILVCHVEEAECVVNTGYTNPTCAGM